MREIKVICRKCGKKIGTFRSFYMPKDDGLFLNEDAIIDTILICSSCRGAPPTMPLPTEEERKKIVEAPGQKVMTDHVA